MAKQQNQKENPNNFFARNIRENGEDFLNGFTSDQLQIFAVNVFRDMVKGKIDITKYVKYLCDDRIIDNFIIAANMKYELFKISYEGMCCLEKQYISRNEPVPDNIKMVKNHWGCSSDVYGMILQSFACLRETRNIGVLQTLIYNVRDKGYRYYV